MDFLFLHTISIFRVARYPSAIREVMDRLSRHLEDDYAIVRPRNQEVESFIESRLQRFSESREYGLIREKPGHFIWLHFRDREALVCKLAIGLKQASAEFRRILCPQMLRAHWYVARWYGRLLLSSLDPLCAGQAIDHILRGIAFANTLEDRVFDNETSVTRIPTRMLRHARHVLSISDPLFGQRLSDQFASRELETLIDELHEVKIQINAKKPAHACMNEVPVEIDALELHITRLYTTLQRRSGRFDEVLTFWSKRHRAIKSLVSETQLLIKHDVSKNKKWTHEQLGNLSRWHVCRRNWCAIRLDFANCLLCSRRYKMARRELLECLTEITGIKTNSILGFSDIGRLRDQVITWSLVAPRMAIEESIQVLERLMYLEMHTSQSEYLASGAVQHISEELRAAKRNPSGSGDLVIQFHQSGSISEFLKRKKDEIREKSHSTTTDTRKQSPKTQRVQILKQARLWGNLGLSLLRHSTVPSGPNTFVENVRLRSHLALCEALIAVHSAEGSKANDGLRFAKIVLTQAQTYLDEFPLKHAGKLRAVFELRVAEIAILEAGIGSTGNISTVHGDLQSLAHVYDALRAIKRAERVLSEHRKSRWWWWILLVLKIKACEYIYQHRIKCLLSALSGSPDDVSQRIRDACRQVPPFAVQFLRSEICGLVAEIQLTDILLMARVVHSFKTICHHDMSFEEHLFRACRDHEVDDVIQSRGLNPHVRLGAAKQTLERLSACLKSAIEEANYSEMSAEIDQDTRDYAKLVLEQAEWCIHREPIWK